MQSAHGIHSYFYCLTIDYRELNKVAPPLHAAVPDIVSLVERIIQTAGEFPGARNVPAGFWSKQVPLMQKKYCPLEKQLLAACTTLQHTEATTGLQPVTVQTDLPIGNWVF